jgi:hypothetical protein
VYTLQRFNDFRPLATAQVGNEELGVAKDSLSFGAHTRYRDVIERHLRHWRDVILGVPPLIEASRRLDHTLILRVFFMLIFSDVWQHLLQMLVPDDMPHESRIGALGQGHDRG